MRIKAAFILGGAVGYVLGTRAGREQFEKIRASARSVWENPRVQETVSEVEDRAAGLVRDLGPEIKEKVSDAVRSATGAVRSGRDDGSLPGSTSAWDSDTSTSGHPNGTTTGSGATNL